MVAATCAGCGAAAPDTKDDLGYRRVTPSGWLWLTTLGGVGKWYFCSIACVQSWAERCEVSLRRLAV